MPEPKCNGTRVSCEIWAKFAFLNYPDLTSEPCRTVFVTPQKCGIRFDRPFELGTRVQFQRLPTSCNVIARVVNCTELRPYEQPWSIEFTLDEPGNVWGIEKPPEDWQLNRDFLEFSSAAAQTSMTPLEHSHWGNNAAGGNSGSKSKSGFSGPTIVGKRVAYVTIYLAKHFCCSRTYPSTNFE